MSPVRATALQLSLDLQLRTLQLSRYARSKRNSLWQRPDDDNDDDDNDDGDLSAAAFVNG